jgi:hypothetical protein
MRGVIQAAALVAAGDPALAQSPSEQPLTLEQVLERGFEIKAAATAAIESVPHEQIYLQKERSAYICIPRRNASGKFAQLGCYSIR